MGKFKHYSIAAYRALKKNWLSSMLSMAGLTAAFSLSLISGAILWKAYSSDSQWENASQIYMLDRKSGNSYYDIPFGFLDDLRTFSPDILKVSALKLEGLSYKTGDKKDAAWVQMVDEEFASMFALETLSGNFASVTSGSDMIAITKEVAVQIFGDSLAVGQTVETSRKGGGLKNYTVGAVYEIPGNTTLIRSRLLLKLPPGAGYPYHQFLLMLKKGADAETLFARINSLFIEKYPTREAASRVKLRLAPLKGAKMDDLDNPDLRKQYLGLFYSSILMLLVAFLNYVSLSTAVATTRRKDIALRNVFGASKSALTV